MHRAILAERFSIAPSRMLAGLLIVMLAITCQMAPAAGLRVERNIPQADFPADLLVGQAGHLLELGYLDVTKPPYSADPTGQTDARAAIQRAVNDAYENNLVAWFPKGTYTLSGGITAIQRPMKPHTGSLGQRKFAPSLMGDSTGGTYPTLRLADSATDLRALRDSVTPGHAHYGKPVFLPRGHYFVRQPVEVPLGAVLLGASLTTSIIEASTDWRPDAPTAIVRTEDGTGSVILADFGIHGNEPAAVRNLTSHKHIVHFHGRSSDMLVRDVQITRREFWRGGRGHYDQPVALYSGNAGGRVYNLALDLWHGPAEVMEPGHRMILVDGTHNRLRIYQPNAEGTGNTQAEIANSRNVTWYGYKFEEEDELLRITNSSGISILGGSGNYTLKKGEEAIITITNSEDVLITNLARQDRSAAEYAWVKDGDIVAPANARNLTLYQRGQPQP